MGTITFSDVLPDPSNLLGDGGQTGEGSAGPGFKTVTLESKTPVMRTRTNSGTVITRSRASHTWTANISYNPLTRAAFEPVDTFLLQRQTSLKPFLRKRSAKWSCTSASPCTIYNCFTAAGI